VKRILGTAEDYRRLYGGGVLAPVSSGAAALKTPAPALKAAPSRPPAKKRATPPSRRRPAPSPTKRRPG
jgi:hypothetical protein